MIASDCSSTSPVESAIAGTRFLRIDGAEFLAPLPAAVAREMHRLMIIGQLLQIERDAHPIGRRRAEISIKLHGVSSSGPLRGSISFFSAFGERRQRPVERRAVGGRDHLEQVAGERLGDRREVFVDGPARRRQ